MTFVTAPVPTDETRNENSTVSVGFALVLSLSPEPCVILRTIFCRVSRGVVGGGVVTEGVGVGVEHQPSTGTGSRQRGSVSKHMGRGQQVGDGDALTDGLGLAEPDGVGVGDASSTMTWQVT